VGALTERGTVVDSNCGWILVIFTYCLHLPLNTGFYRTAKNTGINRKYRTAGRTAIGEEVSKLNSDR